MAAAGGGAGAGIGGNGGKGGKANAREDTKESGYLAIGNDNPAINLSTGWDGENGEDCGKVSINNNVKVYAYGGAGGSGGEGNGPGAGGGGGYPAAGIGGGGAGGGGADHCNGGGGFSGAGGEFINPKGINGLGGGESNFTQEEINDMTFYHGASGGGGYYTRGMGLSNERFGTGAVGGMGGTPWAATGRDSWFVTKGGDGGKGGAGGIVTYSNANNIFAYNGNMLTETIDSLTQIKEYNLVLNEDGKTTKTIESTNALEYCTRYDGTKFIPAKIFAQSGCIRETYTCNQGNFTLGKVEEGLEKPSIANNYLEIKLVLATKRRDNIKTTEYSNGYLMNQGIGSGAGYLEAENGEFKLIEE